MHSFTFLPTTFIIFAPSSILGKLSLEKIPLTLSSKLKYLAILIFLKEWNETKNLYPYDSNYDILFYSHFPVNMFLNIEGPKVSSIYQEICSHVFPFHVLLSCWVHQVILLTFLMIFDPNNIIYIFIWNSWRDSFSCFYNTRPSCRYISLLMHFFNGTIYCISWCQTSYWYQQKLSQRSSNFYQWTRKLFWQSIWMLTFLFL